MPEAKPNAPNEDNKEQNAKGPKKDKKTGGKKNKGAKEEPKRYVITRHAVFDEARIAEEFELNTILTEYSEEHEIRPEDAEVYELGKRVLVEQEVKVVPWSEK